MRARGDTNLTRDEAATRSRAVSVDSYRVDLDLTRADTDADTFGSRTTVRFSARPGSSTHVDLISSHVHEVVLNGRALDPADVTDGARIELHDLVADNELRVVADCAYVTTGEGLHRFVDPVDKETYLYTQFEEMEARRVFACFDQPDVKASFSFTVHAPERWQVVSVSPTAEPTVHGDGTATWRFAPTGRLSTYVTALVAGPYHVVRDELTSSDGRTVPLGVFCRASLAQYLDADDILDVTRQGFAYYESTFDRTYPFEKYDQLFVPEFNAGAMENAGAVTFTEAYVFRSRVPEALYERRGLTVLHELAHMWFGDLVTMRWWDDLWLNESFAEWASTQCMADATRWSTSWTTFLVAEKSWAYRQDQLPSTHPVAADIVDLAAVEVNFDGITYAKGAAVLKQLVAWVGHDAFIAGLRAYFANHAWGNTELADLLSELERTSGRDLSVWADAWLRTSGVATLRPALTLDAGAIASLEVLQEAPAEHPHLRSHRIAIGAYDLHDGALVRTARVEIDVDGARTAVPELAGAPRPDLLLLNDDDLAYAKIRLDDDSLTTAVAHLGAFSDALPRTLVWSAAWDMTRDAETGARRFAGLVLDNVTAETDSSVLRTLLAQLQGAVRLYTDPDRRDAVAVDVADQLLRLASAADAGSDAQLQLARSAAGAALTPDQLAWVRSLLDGTTTLDGLVVDTDMRWDLLTTLVAGGAADADEVQRELDGDDTASGRLRAATAYATFPTLEAKEAAWQRITTEDLPNAVQAAVIGGFSRANDPALLEPFVDRYLSQIAGMWGTRTNEMAQQVVVGAYPVLLASSDLLARTDVWLESHADEPAALRRLVGENRDGVARALRAQARDAADS